jgi:hypothetical protein
MSNPIDFAQAIAKARGSEAAYLLNHSQADGSQQILEWRAAGGSPTQQELYDGWLLCTRFEVDERHRLHGDPERGQIEADGVDAATITVVTGEDETTITVRVRDQEVDVDITGGAGQFDVTAGIPTEEPHIEIEAKNQSTYGTAKAVLEAV